MNGDPLDRLRLTPQSALDHHHKPGDPSIVSGLHVFYFRAFEEEPGCPSASPFSSLFLCKKSSSWDANYLGPAKTVRITDITFQLEGNGIERSFEQVQSRLSSDVVLHTRLHLRFRSKTTPKSDLHSSGFKMEVSEKQEIAKLGYGIVVIYELVNLEEGLSMKKVLCLKIPHQDGLAYFPVVAILSLGLPVVVDFTPHSTLADTTSNIQKTSHGNLQNYLPFSIALMPRSLLVFKDTTYSGHGCTWIPVIENFTVHHVHRYHLHETDSILSSVLLCSFHLNLSAIKFMICRI
ncbi:unnamed protein product [Lactuca saligna]|uniref:Uncharacterized protein n=1 Tax=Lactuca saligna TaxID=75948 RepID=A0AA35UWZ8_LACSI|nr:unnamed protein product [Lactuca saligna]